MREVREVGREGEGWREKWEREVPREGEKRKERGGGGEIVYYILSLFASWVAVHSILWLPEAHPERQPTPSGEVAANRWIPRPPVG